MTECWCSNKYQIWCAHCVNNLGIIWIHCIESIKCDGINLFSLVGYDLLSSVHETWHQCDCHIINQFVNISFSCVHLIFICSLCLLSSFLFVIFFFLRCFFILITMSKICLHVLLFMKIRRLCTQTDEMQNIFVRFKFVMPNVYEQQANGREREKMKRNKRVKTMKSKWNLNEITAKEWWYKSINHYSFSNEPFASVDLADSFVLKFMMIIINSGINHRLVVQLKWSTIRKLWAPNFEFHSQCHNHCAGENVVG